MNCQDVHCLTLALEPMSFAFHHTKYSAVFKISFGSIHMHTVDLSVYFSPILINIFFPQKFNTISFGIPFADSLQNSIFGTTGVATATKRAGLSERVNCHMAWHVANFHKMQVGCHVTLEERTAVLDAVSILVNACALLAAGTLHLSSSPDSCAAPCLDP